MTKHLFIIDDDLIFRLLTQKMIAMQNYSFLNVVECGNGLIGLNALEKLKGTQEQVIILLDINMPVLNGWEFLEQFCERNLMEIKNLLLHIVSSSIDEQDKIKASKFKIVNQFLEKPLSRDVIKMVIEETSCC